ncbi:aconitate hydratase [Anaerococcus degeneri]|uniref:Aconitate hydratase n=1 Tax=Anaerococcus degeneri TaxID=361500 RepID=A0ABS7Z0T1_9FIRM|nr:aconitate hydratase [Anaerococcus degeneri]MBP2016043.1 aconitate hydratase [Anaerococcus degeneri]MCA2096371.1 aconitate hydratase [Anaerococcus degeneri]
MGLSLAMKILKNHLLKGELKTGEEIAIKIDQTLTQDSTGTMAYLQLEAMDIENVATENSVAYIDHNILQAGFENADDHEFIKSAANKFGITFSKAGGGICHQVNLEQFAKPGDTLLGSDSHTPTGGGMGELAIGAGGLEVAVAMAKGFYFVKVPKIFRVNLINSLNPAANAKDVILYILGKLTVKGGTGYIMEYTGEGVKSLSVTDRATICNMGAELGATTSIFPSDENTKAYLKSQGREEDYVELSADSDAFYDESIEIDLGKIAPAVAKPHFPDQYSKVIDLGKIKLDQVAIGSCTNSSYMDLMKVAAILDGRKVHPDVSLVISPGSATILEKISENGALATMIKAGARVLESGCGPCIGMGQAPRSGGVSLRSFNRNFKGRSGTMDAQIYLASPETCAASAVLGYIADPSDLDYKEDFDKNVSFNHTDAYFIRPEKDLSKRIKETVKGKNIKPFPKAEKAGDIDKKVVYKAGDGITTDDICPSNAHLLPFRSNIEYLSNFAFTTKIDDFKDRCQANGGGIIVAGENYGQGSSREHAALLPLFLGIKAVVAKSFARIHRSNLINNAILPLVFENESDYEKISEFDDIKISNMEKSIETGEFILEDLTKNIKIKLKGDFSDREKEILLEGGYLNYAKNLDLEEK